MASGNVRPPAPDADRDAARGRRRTSATGVVPTLVALAGTGAVAYDVQRGAQTASSTGTPAAAVGGTITASPQPSQAVTSGS